MILTGAFVFPTFSRIDPVVKTEDNQQAEVITVVTTDIFDRCAYFPVTVQH